MKKCKFCGEEKGIDRVKINGIRSFYSCERCQAIINNTISKQNESYDSEVERLEKDFSTPKDLLNLLYIIPHYGKTKTHKIKTKKSHFLKYLADYPKSNLLSSFLYEILILFVFSLGIMLFEPFKVPFNALSISIYVASSLLLTFLCGVLILNTGVTKIPCKKTWNFLSTGNKWISNNFERICKIKVRNQWVNYLIIFLLVRFPLYILNWFALVVSVVASHLFMIVVGLMHAFFLFIPAYYIDSKRRNSK